MLLSKDSYASPRRKSVQPSKSYRSSSKREFTVVSTLWTAICVQCVLFLLYLGYAALYLAPLIKHCPRIVGTASLRQEETSQAYGGDRIQSRDYQCPSAHVSAFNRKHLRRRIEPEPQQSMAGSALWGKYPSIAAGAYAG